MQTVTFKNKVYHLWDCCFARYLRAIFQKTVILKLGLLIFE